MLPDQTGPTPSPGEENAGENQPGLTAPPVTNEGTDSSRLSGDAAVGCDRVFPDGRSENRPGDGHPEAPPSSGPEDDLLAGIPDMPSEAELLRLRELLFGRELAILDKIILNQKDERHQAKNVSGVIAEAILLRSGKDNRLNVALEPVVDEVLKTSLRKRQADLVAALFPLMGPSIRRSISESFRSMLGSFSKSLEVSFSWQGLRWRMEALRSGKPFSEIVLLHTLVYRVEQIFFIHSETGLVLSHLVNEGVGSQDADMVSAMLTAIQDFVRDCFTGGDESDHLEALRMGEYTIMIEKTPLAYIACVLRGSPPSGFGEELQSALELMLVEYADDLESFNGDTAPFSTAGRYLEPLLISRFVDDNKKLAWWAKLLPVAVLAVIIGGIVWYSSHRAEVAARKETGQLALLAGKKSADAAMRAGLGVLREEPGFLLIHADEPSKGPWVVTMLKDPLAFPPETVLQKAGFDPAMYAFKITQFVSYDNTIIKKRVEQAISLPDSVSMELDDDGVLYLRGVAPLAWIAMARDEGRAVAGVTHVNTEGLYDPIIERIDALKKSIDSTVIEFPLGKDVPVASELEKLTKAVDSLIALEKLTSGMGFTLSLTIYGHADRTGPERRNYEISQARTRTVAAMLYARGSSIPVSMYGMGSEYPKHMQQASEDAKRTEDQASRRIELRVHIMRPATGNRDIF